MQATLVTLTVTLPLHYRCITVTLSLHCRYIARQVERTVVAAIEERRRRGFDPEEAAGADGLAQDLGQAEIGRGKSERLLDVLLRRPPPRSGLRRGEQRESGLDAGEVGSAESVPQ